MKLDFEANMKLTTATEDDVDEYARELCGEFTCWALLKRHKALKLDCLNIILVL